MNRLSSKAYRDASRGMPCTLRMPGCTGGGEDTVYAHIRDSHTGRSIKASDISGCDACSECHDRFDSRRRMIGGALIPDDLWLFYALRGLQETLEARVALGVLGWPADAERSPRRKSVAGKSPKIKTRPHQWAKGRKMQSRNMFHVKQSREK